MCANGDCGIDCYFNVGGHCKYGVFETDTKYEADEVIQCNPETCGCVDTSFKIDEDPFGISAEHDIE